MPAADESQRRYQGPDAEYAIRERDLRADIRATAVDRFVARLARLDDDQVAEAVDAVEPLINSLVDKGIIPARTRPIREQIVRECVAEATAKVLGEYGTVAAPKSKRMKPPVGTPTSGPATRPVVLKDPGRGDAWVVYPNRYERTSGVKAMLELLAEPTLPKVRTGTERREQSDDILADLKRPVRKAGRNSGKQKGRVGGPMITRSGRP
jgi:hypothetical protein